VPQIVQADGWRFSPADAVACGVQGAWGVPPRLRLGVRGREDERVAVHEPQIEARVKRALAPRSPDARGRRKLPRCGGWYVTTRDCDSLESRMDAECAEEAPDVVTHCLGADMQLARDLSRRMALFEQPQHLVLPRSQVWMRWEWRVLLHMLDVTEDTDDVTAAFERDCAQFCLDALTLGI
jgi:hypothetical protein